MEDKSGEKYSKKKNHRDNRIHPFIFVGVTLIKKNPWNKERIEI